MNYEVVLSYGDGGMQYLDVENVSRIHDTNGLITFSNEQGEDLLIVPISKLVYAQLVTE
ncbi:hypothetical protein ACTHOQ_14070 [Solibacillus silvestris]|uniref:hypothetical protein n=1 Tax=Solibacillus silvestris TaxID=76853 RepID=UPI003F7E962A